MRILLVLTMEPAYAIVNDTPDIRRAIQQVNSEFSLAISEGVDSEFQSTRDRIIEGLEWRAFHHDTPISGVTEIIPVAYYDGCWAFDCTRGMEIHTHDL